MTSGHDGLCPLMVSQNEGICHSKRKSKEYGSPNWTGIVGFLGPCCKCEHNSPKEFISLEHHSCELASPRRAADGLVWRLPAPSRCISSSNSNKTPGEAVSALDLGRTQETRSWLEWEQPAMTGKAWVWHRPLGRDISHSNCNSRPLKMACADCYLRLKSPRLI